MLGIGRAGHPGLGLPVESIMVNGWLTHADAAVERQHDFLVVPEHRLFLSMARNEKDIFWRGGVASVRALATGEAHYIGAAGVCIV